MQQLLDQSLSSDSWSPLKIKFNWDASYWTKQISSFGKKKKTLIEITAFHDSFQESLAYTVYSFNRRVT